MPLIAGELAGRMASHRRIEKPSNLFFELNIMKTPSFNLTTLILAAALFGMGHAGVAQTPSTAESVEPPLYGLIAPEDLNPALPNVLLLGDSISIGYYPSVREKLAGIANVYRIRGTTEATIRQQGQLRLDTNSAVKHIDEWLGDQKWSVIHFNWGLHDVKLTRTGGHQVELDRYEQNLRDLVSRLQQTQAKLIWASITPVPSGADAGANARKPGDEILYNTAAKQVMEENGIPIDDLYALAAPRLTEFQQHANVHFNNIGSAALGSQVAAEIKEALSSQPGSAK